MGQIPLGNFGYATPEVRQSQVVSTRVQDNSAIETSRMIGGAVQDVANEFKAGLQEQADLEARKKRKQAAMYVNEYETKLQAAELDLERQHAEVQ